MRGTVTTPAGRSKPAAAFKKRLAQVQSTINEAASAHARDPASINLIAASKTQNAATLREALRHGVTTFGENYVDEALQKMAQLAALCADAGANAGANADADGADPTLPTPRWHFIGRIQSNKTRQIANHFDWVHTIDRLKIAQRLNDQREQDVPLRVLLQVNLDQDVNKGGVDAHRALELAEAILELPQLQLAGLMTILHPLTPPAEGYANVAQLAARIGQALPEEARSAWQTLSMGMSADLTEAIGAGATHIRIGTALFGPRQTQPAQA